MNLEIKVLAPKERKNNIDYGDCIIINDNGKVIVYDCGSEELAEQVLCYLKEKNIDKVDLVLSHNDSDHFDGIPKLVDNGVINSITTLLLLKYKNEIFDKVSDNRVTKDSLIQHIEDLYSNIYSLSGQNLKDALEADNDLSDNLKIVGPATEYFIDAVAKQFTPNESNNINSSTIMNAISVQLEVSFDGKKLLLTGDADLAAFDDKIRNYDAIQLPHHGNNDMAKKVFEKNEKRNDVLYIVSDNKGNNVNGGSDKLESKGHRIMNTKKDGALNINRDSFRAERTGNLNCYEICSIEKKSIR
ncbi:MAG: MBL fold metallo-hydrolase [Erysipelotrichaceae bacterium]|nr:MBL fold metallo-hydrolase [Erysipelotrichaceae bacterium]